MKKILLLACLAAIACGDDDMMTTDAGPSDDMQVTFDTGPDANDPDTGADPDAGDDMGAPDMGTANGVCDEANVVTFAPEMGADPITMTIDTEAATTTRLEMGEGCGNAMEMPNQVAIAVTVPGTGDVGVTVTTDNEGTAMGFDTVLQVRSTECAMTPADNATACFDDIARGNLLSTASFVATGGTTVYVLVTGFAANGVAEVGVSAQAVTAPVLTAAQVSHVLGEDNGRLRYTLSGSDAEGNVASFRTVLLDATGAEVMVDVGMGMMTSTFTFGLEEADGMTMFTDVVANIGTGGIVPATVTQTRIVLIDGTGAESDPMTVPVTIATEADLDATCDDTAIICAVPNICAGDPLVCSPPADAPVITGLTGVNLGENFYVTATGTDMDGNVTGIRLTWLDAMDGAAVDINDDGMVDDADTLSVAFTEDFTDMMAIDGTVYLAGLEIPAGATHLRGALLDADGSSRDMVVAITMGTSVGTDGAACNLVNNICTPSLVCGGGTCSLAASIVTACGGATALSFTDNIATAMGTLMPGDGALTGACGRTPGTEMIFTATVPAAGTWDIVAGTNTTATGDSDTVLYAQATCGIGSLACNDDIAADMVASSIEILDATDTVTLVVEDFNGVADGETTDFGLLVRLRQVMPDGGACDMAGVESRCAEGLSCTGGVCE